MIKRTLSDVKPELRRVASQSGLRVDDPRLVEYINLAQERLLSLVDNIPGTVHRLKFCAYDRTIALPTKYERILAASIDRYNNGVFGSWYEFMDFGPGHLDRAAGFPALVDRGESPVFFQATCEPKKVRVYSTTDERDDDVRPQVRVFGYDDKGAWVRSQVDGSWVDGIALEIRGDEATEAAAGSEDSEVKFSKITQVTKPVTRGGVELHWVDNTDSDVTYLCARYENFETNPSFRMYHAPAILDGKATVVHLLARVRFTPAKLDTDTLIVPSLPALRLAMRALAKEDSDQVGDSAGLWELAAKVLRDEARQYFGRPNPSLDVGAAELGFKTQEVL